MKPVVLITDFGLTDHYAGVMKSVIKAKAPGVDVIDVTHGVKPCSILNAQFMLDVSYPYLPDDHVITVVVDPGVGSGRQILMAEVKGSILIVPDNGIISAIEGHVEMVYAADTSSYTRASTTFHGRDIFAPLTAKIAGGAALSELGIPVDTWTTSLYPGYDIDKNLARGRILHVDHFGNCVTSIPINEIKGGTPEKIMVGKKPLALRTVSCATYTDLADDEAGIIPGSSGYLELSMNRQSLAARENIEIEDEVVIQYE